jgi:hypothetical protein
MATDFGARGPNQNVVASQARLSLILSKMVGVGDGS